MLQAVLQTIDSRRQQCIAALKEFLSIPSISTQPAHKPDMQRCAQWLADQLSFTGLDVKIMPVASGKGHPAVVAKNKHIPGRPTVLFYGHYDVQPPEPLNLWTTPPFEPTVRANAIYARGSADDKGQVWAHVEAIMAWQAHGGLPVNLTLLVEGEEEIGSENLADFIRAHRDDLRADVAVISDSTQFARGIPAITYCLRGLIYMELTITAASHDLHSGLYGGAVPNPINVLCELLATLHDRDGRVNIPGYYDKVIPPTAEERLMWAKLPFDEKQFAAELKLPGLSGEVGYSALERLWARPTCDINGITGGYEGPGAKTVIASTASAKVSMRLVPEQDPVALRDAFAEAMRQRCPKCVALEMVCHGQTPAVMISTHSVAVDLASEAIEAGFGTRPALVRAGASIPVVELIKSNLGIDTLLVGFGLPDDCVHSPNEKFDLDALQAGSRTAAVLYDRLARLEPKH
ncbi:MAG TPA: dipeptidase [Tepidisphaeraceae bacterium]|jgi:acetylornithine deacetylase/succinyl-diaminopimelate desuccinylase-like protein|nr:dipeptidase [Tepidisphaeraceae bacterium]